MKILALGDVAGNCGLVAVEKVLLKLKSKYSADVVIVNGENASERNGIDKNSTERLFSAGADVVTGGNHSLRNKEAYNYLDETPRLLRPLNFGDACPGRGYSIIDTIFGRLLVVNAAGQVFMDAADSPFYTVDKLLDSLKGEYDFAVADIHAEATSEKAVFARYFDGKFQAVFGTHTHVQTSDARILDGGCAFITDLGMCGADNSILGVRCETVIARMVRRIPERFLSANGKARVDGAVFTIDTAKKLAIAVESFSVNVG